MTLLQNDTHSPTPHRTAHFRRDWRRALGVTLPVAPHNPLRTFSLLSDHLGRDNRCTHRFLSGESSVLVKLRPHPLPGQVSAGSESLPQGTWGSPQGEALSSTPETTHPLTPGPAQPAQVIPSPSLRAEPLPNPNHDAPEAAGRVEGMVALQGQTASRGSCPRGSCDGFWAGLCGQKTDGIAFGPQPHPTPHPLAWPRIWDMEQ